MNEKNIFDNKALFFIFLALLIGASVFLVITIKTFIGYITVISEAGTITELIIEQRDPTYNWNGFYGLGLMVQGYDELQHEDTEPGGMTSKHLIFDCLQPNIEHEIYASIINPNDLNWTTIKAGDAGWVDNYYNISPSDDDSATRTFSSTGYVMYGSQNITNVPMTYTKKYGVAESKEFDIGILNVSGVPVFFTHIAGIQTGFNNQLLNYQMILPSPTELTYYFYSDPNDVCPSGYGTGVYGEGFVGGTVIDSSTSQTIENVTVGISDQVNYTNAAGFFNITAPVGYQYIVAIKEGYYTYTSLVNITLYAQTEHNISMSPVIPTIYNGTIQGTVIDNSTNTPLANVAVSVAGTIFTTNENGFYNGSAYVGNYTIAALLSDYNSHIGHATIIKDTTTIYNISLEPTTGTVEGAVVDNSTGVLLSGVSISISDQNTLTNTSGAYSIDVRTGENFIIATKTGYENYISNITIMPGQIIQHNINLTPILPGVLFENGTVTGTVRDNETNLPLTNVSVTIAGITYVTNADGFYNISMIEGMHNIVAVKQDYENYISEVTVNANNITTHNIYMSLFRRRIENGTLKGIVKNQAGLPISNVSISIAGALTFSNSTGGYNLSLVEGTHNLVATLYGYQNYVANVTITPRQITEHNITLTPIPPGVLFENGTVTGTVRDNETNLVLTNVSVTIAGITYVTNAGGFYNISMIEGMHNIVAVKQDYENYISEVNVTANNITVHNISMSFFERKLKNGTLEGIVKNQAGLPISNVSVSIAGISTSSNSTGDYSALVIEGTHNLVATRSGYENYMAEVIITPDNITYHNITMETSIVEIIQEAGGAGEGAARRVEEQRPQPFYPKREGEIDYEISTKKILRKLRIGSFLNIPITISNYRTEAMNLKISFDDDLDKLMAIDKKIMSIDPDSSGEFVITLMGNVEVGIYEGDIIISGDIDERIPVIVLVYSEEKLPIQGLLIELELLDTTVVIGNTLRYRVDLQNLLREEEYSVSLVYKIQGENSTEAIIDSDKAVIQTSFSLLKSFEIPKDFRPGDYVLTVEVEYLDSVLRQSSPFKVVLPFYRYSFIGIPIWMILAGTIALGSFTFTVVVYNRKKEEKKRYKTKLNLRLLPQAGERSAFIGDIAETSTKTYLDLDKFQMHTLIAGSTGGGKTVSAEVLVEEALMKGISVIVFDPTAQWTGFLRKNDDKEILGLYPKFDMRKRDARAFNGNIHQVRDGREIIDFKKYINPGAISIFVTDKLDMKNTELFIANTIREVFNINLPESPELKYLMIYDGIHTLLPKFGGSGRVFVQIERAAREFRKWGVGLILISQVLSDFPKEVLANINTEIQTRTRDEGDLNRIKEEYGYNILKSVVKAATGTSMIESSAYNNGQPYFVSFRPPLHSLKRLSEEELKNYEKYNKIIDDLEYQVEQLKEQDVDVFDLELELKLAKDKINSGAFNIVSIYLDGLTPRVKAQWEKLGKAPKKKEIRLASEDELERELKDVKKANEGIRKEEEQEEEKKELKKGEQEVEEAVKEEAKEEEEEEKTVVEDIKIDTKEDKLTEINNLITKLNNYLDEDNKKEAIQIYNKITLLYREIPKEHKKEIFNKCQDILKRLR